MKAIVLALLCASFAGAQTTRSVYLFEDFKEQRWCAYTDQSKWSASLAVAPTRHWALVQAGPDRVRTIQLTLEADSGDWSVEDLYSFNTLGSLEKIRRRIIHESGGFIEESLFTIQNGNPKLQKQETKSAYSGQMMKSQRDTNYYFFADPELYDSLGHFPFANLIKAAQGLKQVSTCLKATSSN
jgi:hypothetical protein